MWEKFKSFLKRKDIEVSVKRYGIDALGAMAQGLFCSLPIISAQAHRFGSIRCVRQRCFILPLKMITHVCRSIVLGVKAL